MSVVNLGDVALLQGNRERAAVLYEDGLVLGQELGDNNTLTAYLLGRLGLLELDQGDLDRATALLEESLTVFRGLGEKYYLLEVMTFLAGAAQVRGKAVRAARLFGAAQGLCQSTGLDGLERRFFERFLVAARSQLEEGAWEEALKEGQGMSLEEAVDYALENDSG